MAKRILVADTPEADRRLQAILHGHELVFVRTLEAAQRALGSDKWDLLLTGVHFDDSRMFDLLRHLRFGAHPEGLPVVCLRSHSFVSPAISMEGLAVAAKALACNLFLDLTRYADDDQGNAAVRRQIDELLGA